MTHSGSKMHSPTVLAVHGASRLTEVDVDDYNAEISDKAGGFVGDRASGRAFRAILEAAREEVRKLDDDPIGEVASSEISKKQLDRLLVEGDAEAAGLVLGTIEEFATEFADVIHSSCGSSHGKVRSASSSAVDCVRAVSGNWRLAVQLFY